MEKGMSSSVKDGTKEPGLKEQPLEGVERLCLWKERYRALEQTYSEAIQELVLMRAFEQQWQQFANMVRSLEKQVQELRESNIRLRKALEDSKNNEISCECNGDLSDRGRMISPVGMVASRS